MDPILYQGVKVLYVVLVLSDQGVKKVLYVVLVLSVECL
jgi:hypothetical protein